MEEIARRLDLSGELDVRAGGRPSRSVPRPASTSRAPGHLRRRAATRPRAATASPRPSAPTAPSRSARPSAARRAAPGGRARGRARAARRRPPPCGAAVLSASATSGELATRYRCRRTAARSARARSSTSRNCLRHGAPRLRSPAREVVDVDERRRRDALVAPRRLGLLEVDDVRVAGRLPDDGLRTARRPARRRAAGSRCRRARQGAGRLDVHDLDRQVGAAPRRRRRSCRRAAIARTSTPCPCSPRSSPIAVFPGAPPSGQRRLGQDEQDAHRRILAHTEPEVSWIPGTGHAGSTVPPGRSWRSSCARSATRRWPRPSTRSPPRRRPPGTSSSARRLAGRRAADVPAGARVLEVFPLGISYARNRGAGAVESRLVGYPRRRRDDRRGVGGRRAGRVRRRPGRRSGRRVRPRALDERRRRAVLLPDQGARRLSGHGHAALARRHRREHGLPARHARAARAGSTRASARARRWARPRRPISCCASWTRAAASSTRRS